MDDELKRRIAAALDLPADAPADPEVVAALERDPAARAFAQGLYAIDEALAGWPLPERSAADDERFAAAIEKRLGDAPWENTARVRDAIKPLTWDPTEPPPLLEDAPGRAAEKPEHKPMAQSHDDKDNDDDLAGLAALARSSLSPGAPSATTSMKPGPSLHDDAMDESSGIVDIQKLAAIALKQSTPPPAEQLRPASVDIDAAADSAVAAGEAPTRRESAKEASAMAAAAVPASNAAAAERVRARAVADAERAPVAPPAARRGSPVVWMLPAAAAVAVAAWFGYGQLTHSDSPSAGQPAVASNEPAANDPSPPTAAAPMPSTATPVVTGAAPEGNTVAAPAPVAVAEPPPPPAPQPTTVAAPAHHTAIAAADQGAGAGAVAPADPAVVTQTTTTAPRGGAAAHVTSATSAVHRTADNERAAAHAADGPDTDGLVAAATTPAPTPAAHAHGHTDEAPTAAPTTPAAATPHATGSAAPGGGGHAQSIDDLMNRAVGTEHTAAEAAPPPAAALPATPSHAQVTSTLSPLASAVRACTQGATGTATVAMVIRNDGEVQTVSVSGPFEPTVNGCIQGVVRRAHFPAFTRPTMPLVYPFVVQPPH